MPPGRRGRPPGSTSVSKNAQKTLAFGPNASNKIKKPTSVPQSHIKKLSPSQKSAFSDAVSEAEIAAPESPVEDVRIEGKTLPIRHQQVEKEVKRDEKEVAALKVSEAQIKKYWKEKEDARIAPRVHQEGLGVHEKILRHFDLNTQFGPCIGITRTRRWKRADNLGLKPPLEVLAVLLKEEESGEKEVERAYVDTLMAGSINWGLVIKNGQVA
ncbi:MAG: hypothetical protein Q9163_002755 [Psora crenata]